MYDFYRLVMDSERNPLRAIPPAQRLQAMILLSVMWTSIFCLTTSAWFWYGELIVGHVLVITGIAITAFVFRSAGIKGQSTVATYRDQPRKDGTARYDDVWGG